MTLKRSNAKYKALESKIIEVLTQDGGDCQIGCSVMLKILIVNVEKNITKEKWLDILGKSWDYYKGGK